MLSFWDALRKIGHEKLLSCQLYTESFTVAYAQGYLQMALLLYKKNPGFAQISLVTRTVGGPY